MLTASNLTAGDRVVWTKEGSAFRKVGEQGTVKLAKRFSCIIVWDGEGHRECYHEYDGSCRWIDKVTDDAADYVSDF